MTDVSAFCMKDSPIRDAGTNDHFLSPDPLIAVLDCLFEPAALILPSDSGRRQVSLAHVNAPFCHLTGFNREELLARGFDALLEPERQPELLQPLLDAMRSGTAVQWIIPVRRKSSTAILVRMELTPLPSRPSSPTYWLLTTHDPKAGTYTGTGATDIFERTTDKVFVLDTDWRFIYLNRKAVQNLAHGRDLLGQVIWEAFPETAHTSFEDHYRLAMRDQTPVSFEEFIPPLQAWFEVHAYPSPQHLTVYFRNINRRKKTELAILAQRSELAEVQRLARVTGWECDPSRNWIKFSANASDVIAPDLADGGCTINDLLQRIHPDDRVGACHLFTRPLDSGTSTELTLRISMPPEEMRFLLLRAHPGDGPKVHGILQDITAQRRAELERQMSEDRFRLVFESAFVGIAIATLDGRFIDVNPAYAAMTEYTREELRSMNFLDLTHPEDRDANARCVQRLIDGEVSALTFEKRNITQSGRPVWLRLHVSLVGNELTGTRHLIGIIHDITTQKRAEETLQFSEAQLHQSQKMEAVGRLAGGIAHDFNNLLTVINGYTSLLLSELPAADPLRGTIDHIARAGLKAAGLTNQLMTFGRKQVLRSTTLDINQVISRLEPLLHRLLREDIRLMFVPAPTAVHIRADLNQFEQVLLNLAVNARDAMPDGGELTIAADTVHLGVADLKANPELSPGDYVRLSIRDTGLGMDDTTRQRAFDPFFTTRTAEGATGLGLSTVYGIVQQSGGYITLKSAPGQGTTVQFYLPLVQAKTAAASKRAIDSTHLRGTEKILLAEDEPEVRSFLTTVLGQYGYEVLSAANGAQALELAQKQKNPIHLLVTDMIMPGMNGRALAQQIRQLQPTTPVLYISGYTDNTLDPATDLNEEVQYLKKPFTPRELMRSIRALLDTAK